MLHAYGDTTPHPSFSQEPNPETVRVLDEMVTDFIIESCHAAGQTASTAGRQKVKAEDFHFALRKDPAKLGRVQELFKLERELKEARKAFNENDDRIAGLKEMEKKNADKAKQEGGEPSAKGEKKKKKGKGKGRPKQAYKVTKRRG
jgi:transcription initiation factor TFIID subunit 13